MLNMLSMVTTLGPCHQGGFGETALLATSSADVLEFVSTHPAAIAYVSAGWVSSDVKVVAVEGARPTPAHIADGKYSLVQPFYLIAPREPTGAPRQFHRFQRRDR